MLMIIVTITAITVSRIDGRRGSTRSLASDADLDDINPEAEGQDKGTVDMHVWGLPITEMPAIADFSLMLQNIYSD